MSSDNTMIFSEGLFRMKSSDLTISHLIASIISDVNSGNITRAQDLLAHAEELVNKLEKHRQQNPKKLISLIRNRINRKYNHQTNKLFDEIYGNNKAIDTNDIDNRLQSDLANIYDSFKGNKYEKIERNDYDCLISGTLQAVSIVIPVYNRSKILGMTLAALVHQSYPNHLIEVIVVDDGSHEDTMKVIRRFKSLLNIFYYWQEDKGYRPGQARSAGMRIATTENIITLDCDMLPTRDLVAEYMYVLNRKRNSVLIGPRNYVCTDHLLVEDLIESPYWIETLPEVVTNNAVAAVKNNDKKTADWRHAFYKRTDFLKKSIFPFIAFASGNVAYPKRAFELTGGYDHEFEKWGSEDTEFGYRLFAEGFYVQPVMGALALHQEPPGGENEVDRETGHIQTREILKEKCPLFSREYVDGRSYRLPKYCFINCSDLSDDEFKLNIQSLNYADSIIDHSNIGKILFNGEHVNKFDLDRFLNKNPSSFFIFVKSFDGQNYPLIFDNELKMLDSDLKDIIIAFNIKLAGKTLLIWRGALSRYLNFKE